MANLHLVTGYAGQSHIKAEDHGSMNAALTNGGSYVLNRGNKLSASAITSNTVRVLDGDLLLQGRHVRLAENSYVDLAVSSGAQGMYRNDLIVARYTKNSSSGVEECNLVVIKGTAVSGSPKDPAYNDGDLLNDHDATVDFPLYRVSLNGLTVSLTKLFDTIEFITVGADGKIKSKYLPAMNYIPTSQKGVADGVATLDSSGKVTSGQLPSMNYIPTSQKGVAGGVASLDSSGKVPEEQLQAVAETLTCTFKAGTTSDSISESNVQVVSCIAKKTKDIVTVSAEISALGGIFSSGKGYLECRVHGIASYDWRPLIPTALVGAYGNISAWHTGGGGSSSYVKIDGEITKSVAGAIDAHMTLLIILHKK